MRRMGLAKKLIVTAAFALLATSCLGRISVASGGVEGDNASFLPSISTAGRYVAFVSYATNLVADDTNGKADIFVKDVITNAVTRVSVSTSGAESDAPSWAPVISADGRRVVYWSHATTLVDGETGSVTGAFLHDLDAGTTTRVALAADGTMADGTTYRPTISHDGSTVVFESDATNLVANDTNSRRDIFSYDVATGAIELLSESTAGVPANNGSETAAVSADGQVVAFASYATNLVAGDTNGKEDIFVRDRTTGVTSRVSVSSAGDQVIYVLGSKDPAISDDGQLVAFETGDRFLVAGDDNNVDDIFVHDRGDATTTRVSVTADGSEGDGSSRDVSMSADGRYIVFESSSTFDLAVTSAVRDVFVKDRVTGELLWASKPEEATGPNGESYQAAISAGGTWVAFASAARNLTTETDLNGAVDVFMWLDTD